MITIFTTAKSFVGQAKIAQLNALKSWKRLHPEVEIFLFGRAEGAEEVAACIGLVYVPDIATNELGTPLINAMFEAAQLRGQHDLQMYINCDIILLDDFLPAVCQASLDRFLIVGQRWDLELDEALNFDSDWIGNLRHRVRETAMLHPPAGSDYFVYPRGLLQDIPPLAVGRPGWDNWMIADCLAKQIPVIDASPSITVVHQNHDPYTHTRYVGSKVIGVESERNLAIVAHARRITLIHANWFITSEGLRPKRSIRYRLLSLTIMPFLFPQYYGWLRPLAWLTRKILGNLDYRLNARVWLPEDFARST